MTARVSTTVLLGAAGRAWIDGLVRQYRDPEGKPVLSMGDVVREALAVAAAHPEELAKRLRVRADV